MVVIKKSNSHPDLLVFASRGEEGRVIKANDDESSLDGSTTHENHHHVADKGGVSMKQQQQQPNQYVAKATQLELSFIESLLEEELLSNGNVQSIKEAHGDILNWISLDDLQLCQQSLIDNKPHYVKATELELSFIGSLLEEEVANDDLEDVKEAHGDILDWISLEDLRLIKEQRQPPHATELELSFILSLLEEELAEGNLQNVKEAHGDILDWISLKDLRLIQELQPHATALELSFIRSLLEEEELADDDLEHLKESHGDILSWISLEDLRASLPVE